MGPEQYGPGRYGPGEGPAQYGPGHPGAGQYGPPQPMPGQFGPGPWPPGAGQGPGWAEAGQQPRGPRQPGTGAGRSGRLGAAPLAGGAEVRPGAGGAGPWDRAGGTVIRQRNNALPETPPSGKGPIAAIENDNVGAFARDLRVLRAKAELDYPAMAEKSHYTMRTLASAAGGLRLPTLPVLIAYVKACGGEVSEWEERWGKLVKSEKKGHAALPAAGTDTASQEPGVVASDLGAAASPGDPGQVPFTPPRSGEVYVITSAKPRDDHW